MAPSNRLRIGALTALVFCASAVGPSGCTVGPDYKRPDAPGSAGFKEQPPPGAWKQAQPADGALRDKWWQLFGDAQLDALEEKINVSNQTLKAATGQYLAARDQIRVAHAAYFPTLAVGPSVSRIRLVGESAQHRPRHDPVQLQHPRAAGAGAMGAGSVGAGPPHRRAGARRRPGQRRRSGQRGAQPARGAGGRLLPAAGPRHPEAAARHHAAERRRRAAADARAVRRGRRQRGRRRAGRDAVSAGEGPGDRRRRATRRVRARHRHADRRPRRDASRWRRARSRRTCLSSLRAFRPSCSSGDPTSRRPSGAWPPPTPRSGSPSPPTTRTSR